jgi:Tol biopolymer transport system component
MKIQKSTLAIALACAITMVGCGEQLTVAAPSTPTQAAADRHGGGIPFGIAFVSTRSGNADIWVMNADGTDAAGLAPARDLTVDNPGADQAPAWSNDGRLAFSSIRSSHSNAELYVMQADGSGVVRITNSTSSNTQPAWSPNATELAFVRGAQGSRQIWALDLQSGAERQLTHAGDNYHPAWSPDGKQIIFSSDRNGDFAHASPTEASASFGLHDIYIMDADVGDAQLTRVTNNPTSLDGEPSFSPNGQEIVFRTRRETAVDADGVTRHWCTIAVANVDGSDVRYLTPKPADVLSTKWCNAFPAWSRDGKTIYFHSARYGIPLDIYSVGVDGTNLQRLTFDPAAETAPAVR